MNILLTQLPRRTENARQNFDTVSRLADRHRDVITVADVLILPELIGCEASDTIYERCVRSLARSLGCYLVGGTHHVRRHGSLINCGLVADSTGGIVAEYEKMRPYGVETRLGVHPGKCVGTFVAAGRTLSVLVCADFWYSSVFHDLEDPPDVVLVPTFSVTQRASPRASQALWKHMAVARAYEFAVYVGISDWSSACTYDGQRSSAVAGLANPRPGDGRAFFSRLGGKPLALHALDFERLEALRGNRESRGFPWRRRPAV
jgi:predicted amidohydrolase